MRRDGMVWAVTISVTIECRQYCLRNVYHDPDQFRKLNSYLMQNEHVLLMMGTWNCNVTFNSKVLGLSR